MNDPAPVLAQALAKTDLLIAGLCEIDPILRPILPMSDAEPSRFSLLERLAIVTLLKRFEQMQDLLVRIARLLLSLELEPQGHLTRRDVANWAERFGMVDDADDWIAFAELRNRLTHEYPLDPLDQADRVNACWAAMPGLVAADLAARDYVLERGF